MCLTIHDTLKIAAAQRIDVSMRMIYVELVDFEPFYGYGLFWLGVASSLSFLPVLLSISAGVLEGIGSVARLCGLGGWDICV